MWEFLDKPGVFIVLLLALLLFGAKRLPDSARALGRSMRILKSEAKGLREDDAVVPPPAIAAPVPPAAAVAPPAPLSTPAPAPAPSVAVSPAGPEQATQPHA